MKSIKNLYHLLQAIFFNVIHGFPAQGLTIIGVTGTDGKTTTSSMIYHVLKELGKKVSLISTVAAYVGDEQIDTGLHVTTPDPWQVPKIIKYIKSKGYDTLVIEAASQGLAQNRLWGIQFDTAVFTNIGNDHLDYHGTWEEYAKAKFKLAKQLKPKSTLVINQDHVKSYAWLQKSSEVLAKKDVTTRFYSKGELSNVSETIDGLKFKYQDVEFSVPVIGDYNLENALACIDACKDFLTLEEISKGLSSFKAPQGRMEVVHKKPFTVIIDFAHTPDALEHALKAVNKIRPKGARLITVFGCAGKRDKGRRRMGEVSAKLADITVLTAEDPRDEKLADVNNMILDYAKKSGAFLAGRFASHKDYETKKKVAVAKTNEAKGKPVVAFDEDSVKSREDAIDFAISLAKPQDIVFVTGKAHEKSLSFGADETEHPWSDHKAVEKSLTQKK